MISTTFLLPFWLLLEHRSCECESAIGHNRHRHPFRLDQVPVFLRDIVKLVHGFCCLMEKLINFDAFFGRGLNEEGAIDRLQKLEAFLCLYLTLEVTFRSDDEHKSLRAAFFVKLLEPLFQPIKAFPVINGIHQKDGSCSPIKIISDSLVYILSTLYNLTLLPYPKSAIEPDVHL